MRPGTLDTLLTPQSSSSTWTNGEQAETWADGTPFWASVEERTGREAIRAGQVDATLPVVVTARYSDTTGVTATNRLVHPDGRVFEIQSVREIGRREGREFLCTLNADGGA